MKKNCGFTLIELIITISILGILSIVALPVLSEVRERAEDDVLVSNAVSIINAADIKYQNDVTFRPADGEIIIVDDELIPDYLRDSIYEDVDGDLMILTHVSNGNFNVSYTNNSGEVTIGTP